MAIHRKLKIEDVRAERDAFEAKHGCTFREWIDREGIENLDVPGGEHDKEFQRWSMLEAVICNYEDARTERGLS